MSISQALLVVLGTLAVASGIALLSLDVIFAVTLSQAHSVLAARTPAIVASGLGLVGVALLTLLLGRQIRYRNGAHIQDIGRGPQHTYLLAGCGAIFCILFAVASAVFLGLMLARLEDLPTKTVQSSTRGLIVGAFIIWAVSMISQALFIICIIILQKRCIQHGPLFHPETPVVISSEMKESSRPHSENRPVTAEDHGAHSLDSRSSPSSGSGRSRAGSDTFSSFRSSLSGVVRPITSKTRLVSSGQKGSHRPTSLDSGYRDTVVSIEDGFDSWDTSAVDSQSRQAIMESGSPTPPRTAFPLETIPASPTTSRSPSPGFPLDLEPPKSRTRSRSYSPAGSFVERRRDTRTASPTPSIHEAHIHPLFRTDSPEPPPAATPGTIITAAPSAGQVLSSRSSVKSLRMRSGSFPASPLAHSDSLDSIRRVMEREDRQIQEAGVERTITPPLPSWVLSSAPSPRLASYESRRKTSTGLGKLGEAGEF